MKECTGRKTEKYTGRETEKYMGQERGRDYVQRAYEKGLD